MDDASERPHSPVPHIPDGMRQYADDFRKISPDQLEAVLDAHLTYVNSRSAEGACANLFRAFLPQADFQRRTLNNADFSSAVLWMSRFDAATLHDTVFDQAELRVASFRQADMVGASLKRADLTGADLSEAQLENAVFADANLLGATFRDSMLINADLAEATGLQAQQLAGANLTNAKLPPDVARFDALAHIAETSQNARKIFLAMLLGCVYAWLTIATTTDARLLTNSASSPLPIIQAEIPIAGFYWAAPVLLFGLFLYLHFYLQRIWDGLSRLPAIFPDGVKLHEKAYSWLMTGLVRAHFKLLQRSSRTLISRLEALATIVLAWWVVPFTLVMFWVRYLPRHDWPGTGLHLVLLTLSIAVAVLWHRHAVRTLRGEPTALPRDGRWRDARIWQAVSVAVLGVVLCGLSLGAIDGRPLRASDGIVKSAEPADARTWVPWLFAQFGYKTYADLREATVSSRPDDWWRADDEQRRNLTGIGGADLRRRDLRHADAWEAFLAKADLRSADLLNADLRHADLQGADLRKATLRKADLASANVSGADLRGAKLDSAQLGRAWLQGARMNTATLTNADLQGADLTSVDFKFAIVGGAKFERAILAGANLERARGLTKEQLQKACGDEDTKLPGGMTIQPCAARPGAFGPPNR